MKKLLCVLGVLCVFALWCFVRIGAADGTESRILPPEGSPTVRHDSGLD